MPGQAAQRRALEPSYEDVPPHLLPHLLDWLNARLSEQSSGKVTIDLVMAHMRWVDLSTNHRNAIYGQRREQILVLCRKSPEVLLMVIEFLLSNRPSEQAANILERLLRVAGSAYEVTPDLRGLRWRQDPAVRKHAEAAIEDADEGPSHWLTEAWNDAYAREAWPGPAYEAAIRAVEGALRGIVISKNARASITQIINALRDGRAHFEFTLPDARGEAAGANEPVIDPLDTILAMLRSLAYGQRTRHGDDGPVTINSVEEARAAVQLAVSLVQIGTSNALRRRE